MKLGWRREGGRDRGNEMWILDSSVPSHLLVKVLAGGGPLAAGEETTISSWTGGGCRVKG